ncbi:MAG: serine/threonine protein kinase [Deltaproteobacteria bacterium]|nr:serine/threonine protein kinase [Deltaproteobacteria bacterium]
MAETGTSFGRYRIIRPLGAGGMAEVFLAHQVGPQGFVKPCVLKRVAREFVGDERYQRLLMDEARVSALLNHPHIVQTFDFGQIDGLAYMALELVDGLNLSVLCRGLAKQDRWLPLRAVVEIGREVADALAYAHDLTSLDGGSLKLVHRDVSPANILVSRQGIVKLADFGIARHEARAEVTRGPGIKGKLGYMAPEQAMGEIVDGRADLFSVGVVLAELISARRVSVNSAAPLNLLKLPERVRELLAIRRDCPEELRELVLSCCAIDPDARPARAAEIAEQLGQVAERLPIKDSLSRFLRHVFGIYFPTEASAAVAAGDGTSSQFPSVNPGDRTPGATGHTVSMLELASLPAGSSLAEAQGSGGSEPTLIPDEPEPPRTKRELLASLPPPPLADVEELSFVEGDWGSKGDSDEPAPAAALFNGWPVEFLEKVAEIDTEDPPIPSGARMPQFDAPLAPPPGAAPKVPTAKRPASGVPAPRAASGAPKLPLPGAQPGALGLPAHEERLFVDWAKVKKPRGTSKVEDPLEERIKELLPLALKVIGGAIALTVLIVAIAFKSNQKQQLEASTIGFIDVDSDPQGAEIIYNDQRLDRRTPSRIENVPTANPVSVSVTLPGHVSSPRVAVLSVPSDLGRTAVRFVLMKARVFRVETTPPGALVKMDGVNVAGVTPLNLPPIALGTSSTLTLELFEHLPAKLVIDARTDTPTTSAVTLEASRVIEILTVPPGAKVLLDGKEVGVTPIYQAQIPGERSFTIKLARPGFEKFQKTYPAKKFRDVRIQVDLKPLPLMSMPMSPEEKQTAKELEGKLSRASGLLRDARSRYKRAEDVYERIQDSRTANIAVMSKAQNVFDAARAKVEELEQEEDQARTEFDEFRNMILNRVNDSTGEP